MTRARPIVAIDGPAGAGKSTVARNVADALGYVLVDTGALYRTVALAASRAGVDYSEADAVGELAEGLVERHAIAFVRENGGIRMKLAGEDVSDLIRTPDIGMGASTVSAHPRVRAALLDMQRQAGIEGGVVLEGRDIGTVVFPDAEVKVFLTARAEVRAKRRFDELAAKGDTRMSLDETLADVKKRDTQDSSRPIAPLKQAPDAVLVDTTEMTIEQAVRTIADLARARSSKGGRP